MGNCLSQEILHQIQIQKQNIIVQKYQFLKQNHVAFLVLGRIQKRILLGIQLRHDIFLYGKHFARK